MCLNGSSALTCSPSAANGPWGSVALDSPKPSPNKLRLHVWMAQCGAGSRRACESWIAAGRVAVNGKVVTQMGVTLDPHRDAVSLDGRPLRAERMVYLLLNKPHDVLCTCHDPEGRRTVLQYLPRNYGRLYPVGRLDRDSEGLLLITNDGALALAMTHPRYGIQKVYEVRAATPLPEDAAQRFRDGIP